MWFLLSENSWPGLDPDNRIEPSSFKLMLLTNLLLSPGCIAGVGHKELRNGKRSGIVLADLAQIDPFVYIIYIIRRYV